MRLAEQMATQLRGVYFGGNWTEVNLKESLAEVNWQQATTRIHSFNTIARLVYHMNYYIRTVMTVLAGGPLDASDKYSFDHPPVLSADDWKNLLNTTWSEAEQFATVIEQLPESRLWEAFPDNKYGNYYRNISGITEHVHYHLGQIVLIKKMILQEENDQRKLF